VPLHQLLPASVRIIIEHIDSSRRLPIRLPLLNGYGRLPSHFANYNLDPRPGAMSAAFQRNQVRHFQASHTPRVGNEIYGNNVSLTNVITDTLLAAFHTD
jgi:hypothetical protein